MIEFKGFLISWDIVELIRERSSLSAFEVSYNIFYEISIKQIIFFSTVSVTPYRFIEDLTTLLFILKNLNLGINSSSIPFIHCKPLII
jgi:hypothetical protein